MTLFRRRQKSPATGTGIGIAQPPSPVAEVSPALAGMPAHSAPGLRQPNLTALQRCLHQTVGDRFAVLEAIAIGGMAVLFQLRHHRTGGLFVAKLMRPELAGDPLLREAFTREASVGARLAGHPNAVPILDLAESTDLVENVDLRESGKLPYLLMPYIDGHDLDQVLQQRGRLERDEALMLLAQISSFLMYAETEGIVHADIALGNLRLDSFGQYRLLDYGLARNSGQPPAELAQQAGTPAYNSPEQLRGEPLDIRSDLYSLGLVLFHALAGRPAFHTEDLNELAKAHFGGSWEMPPEIEADVPLAALLRSLLAVERDHRMRSAFELAGAMTALGYEQPSFLRSLAGPSLPLSRLRRRRLNP